MAPTGADATGAEAQLPVSDARHPQFGQYVASGQKARDVYAAMTRTLLAPPREDNSVAGQPSDHLMRYLEQAALGMISLQLDGWGAYVYLQVLRVPADQRGHGIGTAVLSALCEVADRCGWTLTVSPSLDFGATSLPRLKALYRRCGFVPNRARHKDYSTQASMIRHAKK